MSDAEVTHLVPFIFEKASSAKGRFKEVYWDLIEQIKSEDLLPPKVVGPLVCAAVMEGSSHPKARLLAYQEGHACVEMIGLSGIGKRGVLAAAKQLSVEKVQENKHAALDLLALILSKMNGDMNRFSRICGASLTPKSRSMIEERMKKLSLIHI